MKFSTVLRAWQNSQHQEGEAVTLMSRQTGKQRAGNAGAQLICLQTRNPGHSTALSTFRVSRPPMGAAPLEALSQTSPGLRLLGDSKCNGVDSEGQLSQGLRRAGPPEA